VQTAGLKFILELCGYIEVVYWLLVAFHFQLDERVGRGGDDLHSAVWFVQEETFSWAPDAVAFGVNVPSHISIRCQLYHCLIPNSDASSSATSPKTPFKSLLILRERDSRDVSEAELEELVLETRFWPRVEVLNCGSCVSRGDEIRRLSYSDNVIVFHVPWLVTNKDTEHREHERHESAWHRKESGYVHIDCWLDRKALLFDVTDKEIFILRFKAIMGGRRDRIGNRNKEIGKKERS
jgi:hypothetical protein